MADKKNMLKLCELPEVISDVISIMPYLKKNKIDIEAEANACKLETDTLDSLLQMMEMSTDDLAGTILAFYIYDVNISEDINHELALEELKNRAIAHMELYEQIKLTLKLI